MMSVLILAWAALRRTWPALVVPGLFAALVLMPPVNHDVAAVLAFAQRWLDGERLYADLLDVNPPLVFVLTLAPAWLARATGIGGIAALLLCLMALAGATWALALTVRDRAREGAVERALLDVLPGLVAFGAGYDFGQRETLMAMLALPYLIAAGRRMEGGRPRFGVPAALLAAVGFALKPHFLAVPVLVEAAVLWRARRLDAAPFAMAAVWAAYLAGVAVLFPAYVAEVVPLAVAFYVGNGGGTALGLLALPRMGTATAMLLVLSAVAFRWGGGLARVLALAGLGALASALVQHKGWSYHVMPVELFGCALGCVLAAGWLDRLGAAGGRRAAVRIAAGLGGLFALYLVAEGEAPWNQITWRQSDAHALAEMLRAHVPEGAETGGRVLVLSPGIAPVHPALDYAGMRNTLHSMNIWLLEGAYRQCPQDGRRYRDEAGMGAAERRFFHGVVADFVRAPPDAVVLDSFSAIPDCGGAGFRLDEYFARDPAFAKVWARYREVARQGRFGVFVRGGLGQSAGVAD